MKRIHKKCNLNQLQLLASKLAQEVKIECVIALYGDLGAGKTTFTQYFVNSLVKAEVSSPTFNLLHLYNTPNFTIWHFDLYRLNSPSEVYELGIEDAFNSGVTIIEWPQLIQNILPKNTIIIKIENTNRASQRLISISQND